MFIPIILLPLAAVVQQSLGQGQLSMIAKKQKEILDKHNTIRRAVQPTASNMMKMTWSEKAAESAQKRAEKCTPKVNLKEERTVNGIVCGENVLQSSSPYPWSNVIQVWQKKASNFQYGVGAINLKKDIYSYTQLIWHNSHQIGCGLAYCGSGNSPMYLYICHYCPRGNLLQQIGTPYTEGPPCGDCPSNCEDKLCTNLCTYVDWKTDCEIIIELFSCDIPEFEELCQATCKCKTEMDID